MHFPIVCIERLDTPKERWHEPDCEDYCLNANTDYYGEQYSEKERLDVIRSDWFADMFKGIALVNRRKETITFLDADIIDKNIQDYLKNCAKMLLIKAETKGLRTYDFKEIATEYREYSTLFFNCLSEYGVSYGQTSMDFMEDASYYGGQTVKIGNIFDAHI